MARELLFSTCSGWPTAGLTLGCMNVSAACVMFAKDPCPATCRTTRNLPVANTRNRCVHDMKLGDMTDCIQPNAELHSCELIVAEQT